MPKIVQPVASANIAWSDALLFDGEPAVPASYACDAELADDFLFDAFEDDTAHGLDMAVMADAHLHSRESVPAS